MAYQNMIAYGSLVAVGLLGCDNTQQKEESPKEQPKYFADVPMGYDSGMALALGDCDGDGDLDLIVGANGGDSLYPDHLGKLYLFLNDGTGKFTLKEPTTK